MDTLRKDFLRFSRLHSWYKHIPIEGDEFYVFRDVGEQPRNGVNPEITDLSGMHWHMCRMSRPPQILPYTKVRFGPFLQGVYQTYLGTKHVYSFNLILGGNEDTFVPWIAQHYPEWAHLTKEDWQGKCHLFDDPIVVELFLQETEKYWKELVQAVQTMQQ
jgi:hypothetical protein